MKYIVCERPGKFLLKEREVPGYSENEVLVRIKSIGICGTDLHAYNGNQAFFSYPRILGHELAAEVLEVGKNVRNVKLGDRVGIMPYLSCGMCIACRKGKTNCCTSLEVLGVHTDGGMQEMIALPSDILFPLNDMEFNEIALIEPLSIGAHAVRRSEVEKGEKVVVVGCGPIGLGIITFAKARGAIVIAIDVVDDRLQFAKDDIGADFIINFSENPEGQIFNLTDGDMATVVFDATGNKKALEMGPNYLAHGGKYVLVGLYKGELTFHQPSIQKKEMTLLISRNATSIDFQNVIDHLRSGTFASEKYVTHQVSFEGMIGEFEQWLDPKTGVIKAMVQL